MDRSHQSAEPQTTEHAAEGAAGAPLLTGQQAFFQKRVQRRALQRKAAVTASSSGTGAPGGAAPTQDASAAPTQDAHAGQAPAAQGGSLTEQLTSMLVPDLDQLRRLASLFGADALAHAVAGAPQLLWQILDLAWPSNTGWSAGVKCGVGVTIAGTDIGFPGDVSLGGGEGLDFALFRSGATLEASVKATGDASASGAPSIKLAKTPIGVALTDVQGFTMRVDLGQLQWPGSALALLLQGNLRGAVQRLCQSALSLSQNTQLEVSHGTTGKVSISGEAGLSSLVKAVGEAGVSAGLTVTSANPTQTMGGKAELSGEVGLFGKLALNLAGGNESDPLYLKALASTLLGNINAAAENSVSGKGAVGMRATWSVAPLAQGGAGSLEVGIYGLAEASASVLGQSGTLGAKQEIILAAPDIPGFIAGLRSPQGVGSKELTGLVPFSRIDSALTGQATLRSLMGAFPVVGQLAVGLPVDTVQGSFALRLSITREQLLRAAGRGPALVQQVVGLLRAGDARGALRAYLRGSADNLTELSADVVGMVQGLDLELQAGDQNSGSLSTPLSGDVTGGSLSGSTSLMRVYRHSLTPQQLGLDRLQAFLRGLL